MIKYGNLFDTTLDWKVCTVNCVGVMGKGIALEFKKRFPGMYENYRRICQGGLLKPGKLWAWEKDRILCFPTKDHWRYPSKVEWIEAGLQKFVAHYTRLGISYIAFPPLGCGNGGLSKEVVIPLMDKYLGGLGNLEYEIWDMDPGT